MNGCSHLKKNINRIESQIHSTFVMIVVHVDQSKSFLLEVSTLKKKKIKHTLCKAKKQSGESKQPHNKIVNLSYKESLNEIISCSVKQNAIILMRISK